MIKVNHVTKAYGDQVAVNNLCFHIKEGETVGLLGPNGAGKSTTMNLLTGLIEPSEGEIQICGYDLLKDPKHAKAQIGYMPEGIPLYKDLTVKEFIGFMADLKKVPSKEKQNNIQEAITKTDLNEVQNKLIRNLSRGYKQRVSLAGALVSNPKILILDEPTVGLDPKQITQIREVIRNLGKNHTIILSSHILSEVSKLCKKVIILNQGKLITIDTPENLENKVKKETIIKLTIEGEKEKIENLAKTISGIETIEFIKDNEDGTKEYNIISKKDKDIRKELFSKYAKEQMTIFELKKIEVSLEEAFIELITKNKEEEN
ncbi:MAG: ABC transporter ATP-binding protein [Clostridia bacterium]|nr:ABC transporter ATP-binding protein [Clostridia bacterium]